MSPHPAPIIKWVGGKTKLLPELLVRMPEHYGRYYEPFVGGGALFFRVGPERAVLNDWNADLVATYKAIASDPDAVITRLRSHRRKHCNRYYYAMRDRWNRHRSWPVWMAGATKWAPAQRAAAFIYLNKTCFNGLWRVNKDGEFNVPIGRYKDPAICVPDAIRTASGALSNAVIRNYSYKAACWDAREGDFVYFDPPYDPVTPTANFTSYTARSFGREQQANLAEEARTLVARGCKVMLSNSDTRFVRELYKGFRIDRVMCPRAINSDASKRGAVGEVIITGGYTPRRRAS
jgi:DNA adenine methylase